MKRKPIDAVSRGKQRVKLENGQNIRSCVYIDTESQFIMIKGKRVKVRECNKKRFETIVGV